MERELKHRRLYLKKRGSEVSPCSTLKQWSPKWGACTQVGSQDNPLEGRKYFLHH